MASDLTDAQRHELRALLDSRQQEIGAEIAQALRESDSEHYSDLAGQVGDLEDQALADLLVDQGLAEIHHLIQEYRAIDAAIMRMSAGEYGECVECGGPIPLERLRVNPTALRCVPCQEQFEKTHAHEGYHTL